MNAPARCTVAIGLVNGTTKTGTALGFDPQAPSMSIECASRGPGGRLELVGVQVPTNAVSYVAFHRDGVGAPEPEGVPIGETKVHTPGGNVFHVRVALESLDDPDGFWGRPIARASLYDRIWFHRPRVSAIEDATPLGELLVRQGLADGGDVARAASVQAADRGAGLGQILVEQQVLDAYAVEQAAATQQGAMRSGKRMRLGEILVEAGLATTEQIEEALSAQSARRGKRIGEMLVEAGVVSEEALARTLAVKFRVPYVDLDAVDVDPAAAKEIPPGIVERFHVLPIRTDDKTLYVAMADPSAVEALDMLRFSLGKKLQEVVVRPSQLDRAIEDAFPTADPEKRRLSDIIDHLIALSAPVAGKDKAEDETDETADGSVIRLAYQIILQAHQAGASDIHIEPQGVDKGVRVRQRVDGVCTLQRTLSPRYRHSLLARIKIMAGLDITEKRLPQDGKIALSLPDRKLELRVATLPTANGNEDVVMRLLAASGALPVDKLGLSPRNEEAATRLARQPYGLFLVVGPTGSGKTTTLHALVGSINDESRKIWTAEDPVEITQQGLRQVQMQPKIGLTFASAMRSFLRADPDVILVGEMRDHETAAIGVEASLTGHLVFSTLHTNSAPETIIRLVDMGIDRFTFSDALLGVLAQRLGRRLCAACKVAGEASEAEKAELRRLYGPQADEDGVAVGTVTLWHATGCAACGGSGYKGRVALHELLVADDGVRAMIQRGRPVAEVREAAQAAGMRTLLQDGIAKVLAGATDLRQVLAVCSR